MRLSDAGLRRPKTKLIYPNHRLPPWLTEDNTPRSLQLLLDVKRLKTYLNWPIRAEYQDDWMAHRLPESSG